MSEIMDIDAEIEQDEVIGASLGHEGYCFANERENMAEKLGALTGRPEEIIDGMTILDHIKAELLKGRYRCLCEGVEYRSR